jgi:tRNA pseudouridine55 synthase
LAGLRRVAAGNFAIEQAASLDQLSGLDDDARAGWLRPVDELLTGLPEIGLDPAESRRFAQGQGLDMKVVEGQAYRVYAQQRLFLGVGAGEPGDRLQPRRLISGHEG